eukprot:m.449173 g.449173  ORF g.449173 m.449173 type:complete len:555 (-) comp56899_c0_seq2:276-1940(-)
MNGEEAEVQADTDNVLQAKEILALVRFPSIRFLPLVPFYLVALACISRSCFSEFSAFVVDSLSLSPSGFIRFQYERNKHKPISVVRVHVSGVSRSRNALLQAQLASILSAHTLHQVIEESEMAMRRLRLLKLYKSVSAEIAPATENANGNGIDVYVKIEEQSLLSGGAGVSFGNNEGKGEVSFNVVNPYGMGERLVLRTNKTSSGALGFDASINFPVAYNAYYPFSVHCFRERLEYPESSHEQVSTGLGAEYTTYSKLGATHGLRYELSWREITSLPLTASFSIRSEAGQSLKSALKHTMVYATASTKHATTFNMRMVNEIAGFTLGGDTSFLRNTLQTSFTKYLPNNWTASLNFWTGLVSPFPWANPARTAINQLLGTCADPHIVPMHLSRSLSPSTSVIGEAQSTIASDTIRARSLIQDRFFLGGATDLRGFVYRGVGPREGSDAVGGDFYWALGLHVNAPLPFKKWRETIGKQATTHAFLTAGSVVSSFQPTSVADAWKLCTSRVSASAGFGLTYNAGGALLELNIAVPFRFAASDVRAAPFQLGIGLEFL